MSMEPEIEMNAIVILVGKKRIAGRISLDTLSPGVTMWRIETPQTERSESFTRYYSPRAIYSITPAPWDVVMRVQQAIEHGIPSGHPLVDED